jgi:ketosteroid isomerase-like protein
MSIEQNKAIVRRFLTEVLAAGNVDLIDQLLAPTYVNRTMHADLAGFKAFLTATPSPVRHFEIEELVAEGDAVVARFTFEMPDATGKKISVRGLTYYRLADGRIAEDEAITTPDLAALMPSPVEE